MRSLPTLSMLGLLACDGDVAQEPAAAQYACALRSEAEVAAQGPFVVETTVTTAEGGAPTVSAKLVNVTDKVQHVLHHEVVQPSVAHLTADRGPISGTTKRGEDVALATISKSWYAPLNPCEALPLGQASFVRSGDDYTFAWGPTSWRVPPGRYGVDVALPMRLDHYHTPLGDRKQVEGVWYGDAIGPGQWIELPR